MRVAFAVHRRRLAHDSDPDAPSGQGDGGSSDTRGYAGFSGARSSSVMSTPGWAGSPEATTSGLPVPARASPKAAIAAPSTAAAAAGLAVGEKSWMYPVWMTPSAFWRLPQPVGVLQRAPEDLGPGRCQGGGGLVGAGEPDDLVPAAEQFLNDGGPDEPGRPSHEYAHDEVPF